MNFADAGGIKKAQEPIMIGNATKGDIPKAQTKAIQGAYKPIPTVIKAPRMKFTPIAKANFPPLKPKASVSMAIPGIIAVLIAAFLIKSLPLNTLRWVVIVVIIYTSLVMFKSALNNRNVTVL